MKMKRNKESRDGKTMSDSRLNVQTVPFINFETREEMKFVWNQGRSTSA